MAEETEETAANEPSWSDHQREVAASTAGMADCIEDVAATLRRLDNAFSRHIAAEAGIPTPAELAEKALADAYRLRTTQRLIAEQARNYDAYVAAGGESNPEAKRAWEESCEFNAALIPTDYHGDLGT